MESFTWWNMLLNTLIKPSHISLNFWSRRTLDRGRYSLVVFRYFSTRTASLKLMKWSSSWLASNWMNCMVLVARDYIGFCFFFLCWWWAFISSNLSCLYFVFYLCVCFFFYSIFLCCFSLHAGETIAFLFLFPLYWRVGGLRNSSSFPFMEWKAS